MRSSHVYKNYLSSNSQILDICIGHYFPAPLTCETADQSPKYQSPKSPPLPIARGQGAVKLSFL